jgi:hypothetical protein
VCDSAPVVMNRLSGQIYGPERTVPQAKLALYREDRYCQWQRHLYGSKGLPQAKLARQTTTNDFGEFSFGHIPPGKYLLTISKDGERIDDAEISVLEGPDDVKTYLEIKFPTLPVSISASCGGIPSWGFSTTEGKETKP